MRCYSFTLDNTERSDYIIPLYGIDQPVNSYYFKFHQNTHWKISGQEIPKAELPRTEMKQTSARTCVVIFYSTANPRSGLYCDQKLPWVWWAWSPPELASSSSISLPTQGQCFTATKNCLGCDGPWSPCWVYRLCGVGFVERYGRVLLLTIYLRFAVESCICLWRCIEWSGKHSLFTRFSNKPLTIRRRVNGWIR